MNILNKNAQVARTRGERDMQVQKVKAGVGSAKRGKRRTEKSILNNVVSLRVSDREKQVLERITATTSQSVSDVVREAIGYWLSRRQRLCRQS